TSGTFVRPSGKNLHRFPNLTAADDWGVRPDPALEFRVSPEMSRQLRDWWQQQSLRPGSSNEALPLDDPTSDPQRLEALRYLRDTRTGGEGGGQAATVPPRSPSPGSGGSQ